MENSFQGVYVQIPFCLKKCFYCGFPSYDGKEALIDDYIEALCEEIAGVPCFTPPATVYLGGGTPGILTAEQMGMVVDALKKSGWWTGEQERTFETNPGTADTQKLRAFRSLGFNRVSIGVQTFSGAILESVGRAHTGIQAIEALQALREAGFGNVNVDLMYGLPGQDVKDLKTNLDLTVKLGAKHVSVYGLNIEEDTVLERLLKEGKLTLPSEDVEGEMYDLVAAYLPGKGFARYEISNYALRGFSCKHNIMYWHYGSYRGFGSAACTFDGKERITNTIVVEEYVDAFKAGKSVPAKVEEIDRPTAMAEFVFMGLRLSAGVSAKEFTQRFGEDMFAVYGVQIRNNEEKGWLEVNEGIRLTDEGMRFGNQVFMTFLP